MCIDCCTKLDQYFDFFEKSSRAQVSLQILFDPKVVANKDDLKKELEPEADAQLLQLDVQHHQSDTVKDEDDHHEDQEEEEEDDDEEDTDEEEEEDDEDEDEDDEEPQAESSIPDEVSRIVYELVIYYSTQERENF